MLQLPTLLTSVDSRIVAYDVVQQQIIVSHPYKQSWCMLQWQPL